MMAIRDIWLHAHNVLRSARQIINSSLQAYGLSSTEGNILLHLLTQGEEMGQEQLVEQLDISKPGVSRALNSLEKKGYVTRQKDPHDKRANRVRLTDKAREVGPEISQAYNDVYALALQGISEEEFATFVKIFSRISQNFEREPVMGSRG